MSYTRPDYNAANATWQGAASYTRPAYNAADAAWATVTAGSLVGVESGSDSFAASGQVIVTGILSHTEEVADTLASSGTVLVQGDIASIEQANDVFLATSLIDYGDLAATESGSDIFAATGYRVPKGDLIATEIGNDVLAIDGDVIINGSLAVSDTGSDLFSATGFIPTVGNLITTEAGVDTFAAEGLVVISGNASFTESASDTLTSAGKVLVQGNFIVSEVETDRFLTTANGTRVGSMHHKETKGDTIAVSGDVNESTVVRHLYYKVAYSTDFSQNFTQLIYLDEANAPNPPSSLVSLPTDSLSEALPPNSTDEVIINAVKGETLLKWYKTDIDLAFESQFHPYDSVASGQTSPDGFVPDPSYGTDYDISGLTGLTESTRDVFSASGSSSNYVKPVIIEIRDYVTDLPITSVAVTLAVDGVNKTVTNGVAYIGTVTTGTHTVLASATGYHATNADTIDNDSFTL